MESFWVSVIINNYNYGEYLEECITSVLSQSYPYIDLIIVDDGSTDSSRELLSKLSLCYPSITIILKPNGGQASALNVGLEYVKGEIVCFLDSDDFFYPHKISRISELFSKYPEAGWISHTLLWQFINGQRRINLSYRKDVEFIDARRDFRLGRVKINLSATSGLCFRLSLLKRIFPLPEEPVISADNYIKLASIAFSPGLLVNETLACQRIHHRNYYTLKNNTELAVELHINIAGQLIRRIPHSYMMSLRLAGFYLSLALRRLGFRKMLGYSQKAAKSLMLPKPVGVVLLLLYGILRSIKEIFVDYAKNMRLLYMGRCALMRDSDQNQEVS